MGNIQAIKIGNVVNISINGKLHKKSCDSPESAKELYQLCLTARENPTDENIKAIKCYMNEKTRIAFLCGLESDLETGEAFLAGFNTPIPETLLNVIKEYHENGYPLEPIINFWKLLMINPDIRVRKSLFNFITTHDFVLTDLGYMVVYKAVYRKNEIQTVIDNSFEEFVSNQYVLVKSKWKKNPKDFVVYRQNSDKTFKMTTLKTATGWNEKELDIEILGNLNDLFSAIINNTNKLVTDTEKVIYTDMHTKKMHIELGVPVVMDRKDCDSDPAIDCSYGLHCGATKYVENFGNKNTPILVCLVNPAHVVAVPNYDHSKMRVAEYFPFALATYKDGKIEIIEEKYFESDYCNYEEKELEDAIEKIKSNELPYVTDKAAEQESRPMLELMKIIESRLLDLTN